MHDLHLLTRDTSKYQAMLKQTSGLRSLFKNMDKGIHGAAALAVQNGLLLMSIDDDFPVHLDHGGTSGDASHTSTNQEQGDDNGGHLLNCVPYSQVPQSVHDLLSSNTEGRLLALLWLQDGQIREPPLAKEDALALGVEAIWGAEEQQQHSAR